MTGELSRADSERLPVADKGASSADKGAMSAAETKQKAVLGGAAALLLVAAVWAGNTGSTALPADVRQAREEQIAAMSDAEREQLKQNFAAFERHSPAEQQRLRDLDQAISADVDRDTLLAVIRRYDVWLGEFDSLERNLIKDMPVDARVAEIARRKVKDYRLPREDVVAVAAWLKQNAEARFRDEDPQRWEQTLPVVRSLRAVGQMISHFESGAHEDMAADGPLGELIAELSDVSQQQLTSAGDTAEQQQALARWLRQSDLRRQLHREIAGGITREDLESHISGLGEREQRRWRREWQRDPDYVRQLIFIKHGIDMRGSGGRRGPGTGRGPGMRPGEGPRPDREQGPRRGLGPERGPRPGFGPGGPGGAEPPRRRDGFGRPDDGPPPRPRDRHPEDRRPGGPRPPEGELP